MQRSRGTAVIMAMLSVALIAAIASAVLGDYGQAVNHLAGRHDQAQARWLARTAIDWSRWILVEDTREDARIKKNADHQQELWLTPIDSLPYEEGEISGQIQDDSGKLNLNSIAINGAVDAGQAKVFQQLFEQIGVSSSDSKSMVAALIDWIDSDDTAYQGIGAESSWYRSQSNRRIPPNAPILDVGELAHIRGFESEALLEALRPHVTAHPPGQQIVNVNFASAQVLAALTGLRASNSALRDAVRTDKNTAFIKVEDFIALLPSGQPYNQSQFSVKSEYFIATGSAKWGEAMVSMEVLLRRNNNKPEILWYKIF